MIHQGSLTVRLVSIATASALLLLLVGNVAGQTRAGERGTSATGPLPDLIVKRVDILDDHRLQVIIANETDGKVLNNFLVHLRIYDSNDRLLKQLWQIVKPPLLKGQVLIRQFDTKDETLFRHRFEVEVDVGNSNAETNEGNNKTRRMDGPGAHSTSDVDSSTSVDLAAINIFRATNGKSKVVMAVIRNLGSQTYLGNREAIINAVIQKDGVQSTHKLGAVVLPTIASGKQEIVSVPAPEELNHADAYRLTLTLTPGDNNPANDIKVNTSGGFSSVEASSTADLEAAGVTRVLAQGTATIKGLVRNISSQPYSGAREVHLYFIDLSGNEPQSILLVAKTVKNLSAGADWEIAAELSAELKKVKHFDLKLSISAGDTNSKNDTKTRSFGNL